VLESLHVTLEEVRAQVVRIIGRGEEMPTGQIPFTPRSKKVLELSLREALSLGHNYIGTEHILLGLVREGGGVGMQILLDFDVDAEKVRNEIIHMLSGAGVRQYASASAPLVPIPSDFRDASNLFASEFHEELERLPQDKADRLRLAAVQLEQIWHERDDEHLPAWPPEA
jgi:ATP-dependent Clp protease ATP-binding subunit ClpA